MLMLPPSPYLEDLTKLLVVPPARRKLQIVPQTRRQKQPMPISPYEATARSGLGRAREDASRAMAERHLRRMWNREAAAAAERVGLDLGTYTSLLELQHREITPEDYDVLQQLDVSTQPKTLEQERDLPHHTHARARAHTPGPLPPGASPTPM